MQRTGILIVLLALAAFPLTGQTTGEVLDQKVENIGASYGASSEEIAEGKGMLRNSVPAGALDGGWKVVSPFDTIHVRPLSLQAPGTELSLVISPDQGEYMDTSK